MFREVWTEINCWMDPTICSAARQAERAEKPRLLRDLGVGAFFGERALLTSERRSASAIVSVGCRSTRCYTLQRRGFMRLLAELDAIRAPTLTGLSCGGGGGGDDGGGGGGGGAGGGHGPPGDTAVRNSRLEYNLLVLKVSHHTSLTRR